MQKKKNKTKQNKTNKNTVPQVHLIFGHAHLFFYQPLVLHRKLSCHIVRRGSFLSRTTGRWPRWVWCRVSFFFFFFFFFFSFHFFPLHTCHARALVFAWAILCWEKWYENLPATTCFFASSLYSLFLFLCSCGWICKICLVTSCCCCADARSLSFFFFFFFFFLLPHLSRFSCVCV